MLKVLTKITPDGYIGKERCKACNLKIGVKQKAISCDQCLRWTHLKCSDMAPKTYKLHANNEFYWTCNTCRQSEDIIEGKADLNNLKEEQMPTANSDFLQDLAKDFLILHYNCRSMVNKVVEILHILMKLQPSILCLTETWLDSTSPLTAYVPEGYKIIRRDRSDQYKQKYGKNNGGGIAIIYKENIPVKELNIESDTDETLWVQVKAKTNFILGTIYRASYTDLLNEKENGSTLEAQLTEASYKNNNLIVVGDFNCDTEAEDQDKNTKMLNEIFTCQSMEQLISKPTRINLDSKKATTIDHVWTDPMKKLIRESGTIEGISDHIGVYIKANTTKLKTKPEISRFRSYKNYQPGNFNEDLKKALSCPNLKSLITNEKVDEATELWVKIFVATAEKHAPIKEMKKSVQRKYIPWFTNELESLIVEKQKRLQIYRLYGLHSDIKLVKILTNKISHLKRKRKKAYYSGKIKQYEGEPRKMWKVLKEVTGTEVKQTNIEPEILNQNIANHFNSYFATIGSEIQKRLNIKDSDHNEVTTGHFKFTEENEVTIVKLIDRIKIDVAVGIDDINGIDDIERCKAHCSRNTNTTCKYKL